VAVSDIGDTVPADALPYLFERFFRVDPSRARGSGGAGIGLAIARELVDAHGGTVGASSDGRGVTVWFELPVAAADEVLAVGAVGRRRQGRPRETAVRAG
jgi:signal transduction histidine kinase